MNLRIGEVKNYNNKILISSPSFKIGTNLKINLNGKKDESDVKPKGEGIVKAKSNIEPNEGHKQDQSSDILQHSQNRPTGDRWLKLNLTSSSIKKANLIRIRSPMRKKKLLWYWE